VPPKTKQRFKDAFKMLVKSKGAIERRSDQRRAELRVILDDIESLMDKWDQERIGKGFEAFQPEFERLEEKLETIEEEEQVAFIKLGQLVLDGQKHFEGLRKKYTRAKSLFENAEEGLDRLDHEILELEDDEQLHAQFQKWRQELEGQLEEARDSADKKVWKEALQAIEGAVSQAKQALPVKVRVGDGDVQFDGRSIPGIWDLSNEERQEKLQTIGQQIERGKEVWAKIGTDDEPKATRKDVAAVAWLMRMISEQKAGHWYKGTITVDDPDNKLYKWLRSCSMQYGRWSSHLKDDQQGAKKNIGIDFYEGSSDARYLLPYGTRTILAQKFSRDGQDMLMMKMETEGTKLPFTGGRTFNPKDLGRAIGHIRNYWRGRQHTGMDTHAEKYVDIPEQVRASYDEVARLTENMDVTKGMAYDGIKLSKNGEIKVFEVNQMHKNLMAIIDLLDDDDDEESVDEELYNQIQEILEAAWVFVETCEVAWGEDFEEDMKQRVGDEIILRENDMR
jgi:uncharacterized protein YukE